jgi:hypothetical protein
MAATTCARSAGESAGSENAPRDQLAGEPQ